jgi:hypothetical protein
VLLTLAVCEQRAADDPVPVMLRMAGWDPAREHLHDWIERSLGQEYPFLLDTIAFGPTAARDLVADGRLLLQQAQGQAG